MLRKTGLGIVHILMKAGMEEKAAPNPAGDVKKSVPAMRRAAMKVMNAEGGMINEAR